MEIHYIQKLLGHNGIEMSQLLGLGIVLLRNFICAATACGNAVEKTTSAGGGEQACLIQLLR